MLFNSPTIKLEIYSSIFFTFTSHEEPSNQPKARTSINIVQFTMLLLSVRYILEFTFTSYFSFHLTR